MENPILEMNTFEAILARRSVRKYSPKKVGVSEIRSLLEAAVHAPTAMSEEPWAFLIIQDKQVMRALSDRAKPLFMEQKKGSGYSFDAINGEQYNLFYDANTLIIICARSEDTFAKVDCWLAAENLMLAACAMGLGSCVIGASLLALNTAEEKNRLGISNDYEVVAPITVGYPMDEEIFSSKRKPPLILNSI